MLPGSLRDDGAPNAAAASGEHGGRPLSTEQPTPIPRPEWSPLPHPDIVGVEGKVLLRAEDVTLAMLRFARHASIHEHAADFDIDVVCLEGSGFVSVDGETSAFHAGLRIRWPSGSMHRLWTTGDTMVTLMVERPAPRSLPRA